MALRVEWDKRKSEWNLRAHGVSSPEATTVFADRLAITIFDPDHSTAEMRFVDIGLSHRGRFARGIEHRARQPNPPHSCAARDSQ